MSGIVCAIRGGPASQPTIQEAIRLAKEIGLPIHFLYVVNIDFLTRTSHSRIQTISEEMHEMGEFILLSAQTAAEAQGATTHGAVREGHVREEIVVLCREVSADYVILGRPQARAENDVFTQDRLNEFARQIEAETGAKVVFPTGGVE